MKIQFQVSQKGERGLEEAENNEDKTSFLTF